MTLQAAEAWRRITGEDLPAPFEQKSTEEQFRDWNLFLDTVRNSSDAEDEAVDELFTNIRMDIKLQAPEFSDVQEESA